MTSLSGEFQTDLGVDDAMVACTEAIDGLGWRIDTVDAQRVIAYTDSGEHPPRIEVNLNESSGGTDFRIIGSDNERNPLEQNDLIAVLDKARDAINHSMENAKRPAETASSASTQTQTQTQTRGQQAQDQGTGGGGDPGAPAGWYPDVYDDSRQRYWDGKEWTDDFRPAGGVPDDGEPQGEDKQGDAKPAKKSRKEAREEKRRQGRERAEQRRQERLDKRKEKAQQSGAASQQSGSSSQPSGESSSGAAVGGAAAAGAAGGAAAASAAASKSDESSKPTSSAATPSQSSSREAAPEKASSGEGQGVRGAFATLTSDGPDDFSSLHLIAKLYYYLGFVVLIGGALAVIVSAASAGGAGAIGVLIVGAIGVAFYALLVFGIAAAIRLALAVERNTRDTAELLRRERDR